jgi:segregation and condensation protein A
VDAIESNERLDAADTASLKTDTILLRLELEKFEGPFEVLLYLIKSQEIDIFDIPIVRITEQYLAFLERLQEKRLEVASDFLVMAATLIQIKARLLLPPETEEDGEPVEEEDPRWELVEKLLEYRKFKALAEKLGRLGERAEDYFTAAGLAFIEAEEVEDDLVELSLYDLIKGVKKVLALLREKPTHEIFGDGISVDEKIERLSALLEKHETLAWSELLRECRARPHVVCFLLAILELARLQRLRFIQYEPFGEIRLFRPNDPATIAPASSTPNEPVTP